MKRRLDMQAIVYIRTDPGKALGILDAVKRIGGVKVAFATTGRFDIIARVEAADLKAIGDTVVGKIQAIAGVRSSETAMIVA
jgi:DNA-binding Lrp family transcriptional regulator